MMTKEKNEHNKMIIVTTGSRLHGGFYYIGNEWSIRYGSLGFYIEKPRFVISMRYCDGFKIKAPQEIIDVMNRLAQRYPSLRLKLENACIDVRESIPVHVGLGSTTQLTLSIVCALRILQGEPCDPILESRNLGLPKYSGIGTLLFKEGGFVIDSGLPDLKGPRSLMRVKIPEDWRFVVVIPDLKRGLNEEDEERILKVPWRPPRESERLMARGTIRLLIGVIKEDIIEVVKGLKDVQTGTGIYFSKIQGGVFREDLMEIIAEADRNGVYLAQSSWGPSLYTITTKEMASTDAFMLKGILKDLGIRGEVLVVKPRNIGASLNTVILSNLT